MEIKKLTKEEKAEGLTLDLVNKVDLLKKCSPVMFKGGDEPVGIMECSTGYWVHTSDGYLRDDGLVNGTIVEVEFMGETHRKWRLLQSDWYKSSFIFDKR